MAEKRRPPSTIHDEGVIPSMQMQFDESPEHRFRRRDPSTGPGAFGLSVARVTRVDYAQNEIDIQVISGEHGVSPYAGITVTCPAAGARHLMTAMPESGDMCIVGWLATEPKSPIILSWIPHSRKAGLEWLPVQDVLPTEADMNPKTRTHFEGIYSRTRYKTPPLRPGCIYLSSSQGSDVMLDEGVLLTNRRGNEIVLRDPDQAIVFRSLQQFHATGGARVYAGMVQRDAQFLPRRMFSDGIDWAASVQQDSNGDPLPPSALGSSPQSINRLTPHEVFVRSDGNQPFADSGVLLQDNVDPYAFLNRGFYIGTDGFALDPATVTSDAEYAGKPMFRVSIDPSPENTALPTNGLTAEESTEADTLTEYRIEVDHSWDGRLPVTEQTDGFDADRLPSDAVQESPVSFGGPFVQWVLGSVVGNDPYSNRGRQVYGLPLVPRVFDGETVDPRLESGVGISLGEHAASLFRVVPPVEDPTAVPPTFLSTTKDGRVKGFISGPQNENSVELALNGGLRLDANGPLELNAPNTVLNFSQGSDLDNWALALKSDTGGILIRSSGPTTRSSFSARTGSPDNQEQNQPSVAVESPNGNVHVSAGRFAKISAANGVQICDTDEITAIAKKNYANFSDKWSLQCNTSSRVVQGKEDNLYSGPKTFLPTNRPIRSTKFIANPLTGHFGGETDSYFMLLGDREETFVAGNHRTTVAVGNATWQAGLGTVRLASGTVPIPTGFAPATSSVTVSPTSVQTSTVGVASTQALSISGRALTTLTLQSLGPARVGSTAMSITLTAGGGKAGGIVCSSDRDPLTNLPFATFGVGSPTHRLGAI